jgi:hypothetical protein
MPASLTIPQQARGNLAMQKRHPPTAVRWNCKKRVLCGTSVPWHHARDRRLERYLRIRCNVFAG